MHGKAPCVALIAINALTRLLADSQPFDDVLYPSQGIITCWSVLASLTVLAPSTAPLRYRSVPSRECIPLMRKVTLTVKRFVLKRGVLVAYRYSLGRYHPSVSARLEMR